MPKIVGNCNRRKTNTCPKEEGKIELIHKFSLKIGWKVIRVWKVISLAYSFPKHNADFNWNIHP